MHPESKKMSLCLLLLLLVLPLVTRAEPDCPKICVCVLRTGQAWCAGGSFVRMPSFPSKVRSLTWTDLRLVEFSLSDLSRSLQSVKLRGLKFERLLPKSSGIFAQTSSLDIQGCCGDHFPSLADFHTLSSFRYNVQCQSGAKDISITSPMLLGLGKTLPQGDRNLDLFAASACITSIDAPSLQLLLRYKDLRLHKNRLKVLSSGSGKVDVKRLNVSDNPQLTQLDMTPGKVPLERLDISHTRLAIEDIAVAPKKFGNLKMRGSIGPVSLKWLCKNFHLLAKIDVSGGRKLNVTDAACKWLSEFRMNDAEQTEVPDLRKTQLYKFYASRNNYKRLDMARFTKDVRVINVSGNAIQSLVVGPDCTNVRTNLIELDVSSNNLTALSSDFLKCLPNEGSRLEISAANNPMPDLFNDPFGYRGVSGWSLKSLDLSYIASIRKHGRFPAWIFANIKEVTNLLAEWNNLRSLTRFVRHLRLANLQMSLKSLRLAGNRFEEVRDLLFLGFDSLSHLSLASNRLRVIGTEAFAGMTSLTHLDLTGNRLALLDPWATRLPQQGRILLAGNPFSCECEELNRLANFSLFEPGGFPSAEGVICSAPSRVRLLTVEAVIRRRKTLVCDSGTATPSGFFSSSWVIFALVLGAVVIAIVSAVFTRCLLKRTHKYWMTPKQNPHALPMQIGDQCDRMRMLSGPA